MYTDATPSTGPFKSYAQVVKEPCPPQTQQPPRRHIEIIPDDDDWTDVSSVTSCGWPRSVETDSVFSDDSHSLSHLIKNAKRNSPNPIVEMPEDVPWIDQEIDTRVPHAFAGQIKHCNRSRWRYTNIRPQAVFCGYINEEELLKPWRTFPGCRRKYQRSVHDRIRLNQAEEERHLKAEVREAEKSSKKSKGLL